MRGAPSCTTRPCQQRHLLVSNCHQCRPMHLTDEGVISVEAYHEKSWHVSRLCSSTGRFVSCDATDVALSNAFGRSLFVKFKLVFESLRQRHRSG
jgi:hypothetical protein